MSIEASLEKVTKAIDEAGADLSLEDWIEFLQDVQAECRTRIDAAQADIRQRDGK